MGVVYVCSYCQTAVQQPFGRVVEKQSAKGTPVNVYKSAQGPTASSAGCAECGSAQHVSGCFPAYRGVMLTLLARRSHVAWTDPEQRICRQGARGD